MWTLSVFNRTLSCQKPMIFGGCRGFSIFLGGLENAMWTPVFPIRQILHGVHVKKKNTHGMGPGESNSWAVLDFSNIST